MYSSSISADKSLNAMTEEIVLSIAWFMILFAQEIHILYYSSAECELRNMKMR